jgi:uncharacterized protein
VTTRHGPDSAGMSAQSTPNVTFEVLSHDTSVQLLGLEEIGRLAWLTGGLPHIVPVNYAWDGEAVVIRSDPGTKLEGLLGAEVAFEVDRIDRLHKEGWSVVVHGVAHRVAVGDWPATAIRPSELYLEPWVPGKKSHWVRVIPRVVGGRRITRRNDIDAYLWDLDETTLAAHAVVAR